MHKQLEKNREHTKSNRTKNKTFSSLLCTIFTFSSRNPALNIWILRMCSQTLNTDLSLQISPFSDARSCIHSSFAHLLPRATTGCFLAEKANTLWFLLQNQSVLLRATLLNSIDWYFWWNSLNFLRVKKHWIVGVVLCSNVNKLLISNKKDESRFSHSLWYAFQYEESSIAFELFGCLCIFSQMHKAVRETGK